MAGKLFLSVLLLIVVACPRATIAQSIENATIEREEYAVYSAVILDYTFPQRGTFVIANPTSNWTQETKLKDLQFHFPGAAPPVLVPETLDDFLQRNKSHRWFTPKFELNREYFLVDFREIKKLANDFNRMDQEWKPFFEKYPESAGFVTLSRVGFNRQMDQAVVHAGLNCPGLCGFWAVLMLAKKDGSWKVVGEANRMDS